MDKQEVQRKVIQKAFKLVDAKSDKSSIWKKFKIIHDEKNNEVKNWVACGDCFKIYSFDSRKTGTSNLQRHTCSTASSGTKMITTYMIKKGVGDDISLPREDINKLTKSLCEFVVKDIRPMEAVSGEGLTSLLQTVYDMGVKNGKAIKIANAMPHATTVSRNITSLTQIVRNHLRALVCDISRTMKGAAITTDIWTDKYTNVSFMSLTFHYIADKKNQKRCLGVRPLSPEKKTGDYIKKEIIHALQNYKIHDWIDNLIFVTDRGTNIVNALKGYKRLNCFAHLLNNTVQHALNQTDGAKHLVEQCRKLVRYFKKSGLQSKLSKTLKQDVPTRWNSTCNMLISLSDVWDEVVEILEERDQHDRIEQICKKEVDAIVNFLQPFKDSSMEVEGEDYPTLHLPILWQIKLKKHLNVCTEDSTIIRTLKNEAAENLARTPDFHILYYAAVFLHPKLKNLTMLSKEEKLKTIQYIEDEIENFRDEDVDQEQEVMEISESKKSRLDTVSSFYEPSQLREIEKYKSILVGDDEDFSMLKWWDSQKNILPKLHKMANFIYSIPASSAPSERLFSTTGNIISDKRSSLDPEMI
uniref:Uncharacterized protein n=1 Tax=Phlebotomus papatasi TaxID=29031 RepID=A0A1B0DG64_PHLPP